MSAPIAWVDEARVFYESRPWIALALGMGVAVGEPLTTAREAGAAVARRHGLDGLHMLVDRASRELLRDVLAGAVDVLRGRGVAREVIDTALAGAARRVTR